MLATNWKLDSKCLEGQRTQMENVWFEKVSSKNDPPRRLTMRKL
jgi:hypothetical protein